MFAIQKKIILLLICGTVLSGAAVPCLDFSLESFALDSKFLLSQGSLSGHCINTQSPIHLKGNEWGLSANLFAGGGVSDTAVYRGYVGTLVYGNVDSLSFLFNVFYDSFERNDMKSFHEVYYTGKVAFDYDWFHAGIAHDVIHLGPGVYNNLTFNGAANPYDMLTMGLDLGPLHVYSFYGSLRVAPWSVSNKLFDDRDVYGHRYELALQNFTFGISEVTTLYDNNQPWLFVPTVPLFMEKGNYSENSNNGAIAFDVEYRLWGFLRMYSEFLLDDMESPIRLVANDNAESKWGWMAGMQADGRLDLLGRNIGVGSIVEYARIEPYVYTHFIENTAQMAHAGKPLGNPNGPNSQVVDWSVYFSYNHHLTAVLHNKWLWKGTDYGSQLNDETKNALHTKKSFLKGAKMQYSLTPLFIYSLDHISYQVGFRLFNEQEAYANVVVWW